MNCKYLISYKALDDDWDCDNGFRGKVQFGLSVRDSSYADVSSSNGFEIDNNNNSPSNFNSPRTQPLFSNMTVIGPYVTTSSVVNPLFQRGGHLRRNNLASIYNSILMAWRVGLRFDGSGVGNAAQADTIQIRNNIMAGNIKLADSTGTGSFSPQSWLQTSTFENSVYSENSSVMLNSPFNIYPDAPLPGNNVNNWMPDNGSPALSGASFNNPNLNGFENVTFRGAFGSVNWTLDWAQFNPREYNIIGISQISSVVPESFTLDQNYPNPFNPSTTINFSLPKSGLVSLKVYDISGKEIDDLVNENLSLGSYEYNFNAASLSSGIYFYTLKTDGISQTKRMMLIK